MVLFDDRRDNMPAIDKRQWEVLCNTSDLIIIINEIQECKDEERLYKLRSKLLVKMRYLKEECDKLTELYRREGVKP